MNYIRLIISIAILLVTAILIHEHIKMSSELENLRSNLKISKSFNNDLIYSFEERIRNGGLKLDNNIVLKDIKDEKIFPKDLVKKNNILVLRSSDRGCSICIEQQLQIIAENFKNLEKSIVIITNHKGSRQLEVFKEANKIKSPIFYCNDLGFPLEKETEKSFVFTLDSNLDVNHFFASDYSYPSLSNKYYFIIKELLN